jgi:tetratricopeptide (TPR) repeat protein/CHAT domain-containing protein
MRAGLLPVIIALVGSLAAAPGRQGTDDPKLQAAVQQFFAMQETEDIEGYLSLWSKTAQRPQQAQLQFIFDSGDDKFSEIAIVTATPIGDRVRVRVRATRDRTSPSRVPGGPSRNLHSTSEWGLLYVREENEWKLLREGAVADALADSLFEAKTAEEREAILAAEPDLVNDAVVVAVARRAGMATVSRAYPLAQAGFELMLDLARRTGNRKLEGEALQNIANAMYFRRNFAGALQAYEERLALERTREDLEGMAAAQVGIGTIRYTYADYGAALAAYREALAMQERIGDDALIATTLISTGNVLYLQGDYPGAISDYTRSRDINRKTGNKSGETDALEGMGRVFLAQGDYVAALDAFAGVLAEAKATNNRRDQGTALLSIGDVHFRLGNLDISRKAFDEARAHFDATKDLAYAGRAWQALALIDLVVGRFVLAEEGYKKSTASCGAADDRECVASATVGLAFAETAQDKFTAGIASYKKGIDAFTALKRQEPAARARIGLAQAFAGSNDLAAALDAASLARADGEALANDDVLWRALVARAGALRRMREPVKAMADAQAAISAVDRLVEVAKVRPSAQVARDSSSAFAMLALLQAEAGDAAAAFESAERMRAHDLRVLLAPGERDISRGMTDAERDEERAIAVDLVSLHAQLSREKGLPKPDAARIARLEKTVAEATATRTAQQQRLFERLPDLRRWRGLTPAATPAEAAALLPDSDTALVQLVVGDEILLVLIARRSAEGMHFSSLFEHASRRVLADRVARLMRPETLRDVKAWRLAGLELIPGLSASLANARRAIVIPHEILWRVPFEALPAETGYLADSTTIVYAPSVTALAAIPRRVGEPAALDLLAVSAPALPPEMTDQLAQTAPDWTVRTPASAEGELRAIVEGADPARVGVVESAAATEATLRERLPTASVLHLAAPFRINGASPLFSPFLCAPDSANDAALEAREIMNLDLRARLAIISDVSAMTMREAADEVGVVAWAWRAAGVPSLVMPRWVVEDAVSSQFLTELHLRIRAAGGAEAALRAARDKVRRTAATAAPFFWAGWMLIGQ